MDNLNEVSKQINIALKELLKAQKMIQNLDSTNKPPVDSVAKPSAPASPKPMDLKGSDNSKNPVSLEKENNQTPKQASSTKAEEPKNDKTPKDSKASTKEDYRNAPGPQGVFNGFKMVTEDGTSFDVPLNYAAKSKLVFGDILKRVEIDGRNLFKHIEKVNRKKSEGILNKRDDDWYFLSHEGSYKVSPVAAEFQKAEDGDEALVLLPEDSKDADFATLDKIIKEQPSQNPVQKDSGNSSVSSASSKSSNVPPKAASSAPQEDTNTETPKTPKPRLEVDNPKTLLEEDLR
jgi:hypothetical protein